MLQPAEYKFAMKNVKNIKLQVLDILELLMFPEIVPEKYNLSDDLEKVKDQLIKLEITFKELYNKSKEKEDVREE